MKASLQTLVTAFAVALVAAVVLVPIAGAGGPTTGAAANGMMNGGPSSGMGAWTGTGMWGMGSSMGSSMAWLSDNPAAMQAWLQLRADHQQAMQTWHDSYKSDLTSPAAQQALHDLWTANWNDMQSFHEQYASGTDWTSPGSGMWDGWQMGDMMNGGSWNANHMWGTGYGASWMTSHPAGMGQWLTLRGRQIGAMNAWWQQHSTAPGSPAAQAALRTLNAQQRTQVKHFYRQHHLPTSSAMMRAATGGWMGLGGMWGGFGW
jgi:hypothetical protein